MRRDFIRDAVVEDIAPGGRFEGQTVHTRFPPEPNAYLHIGHAKAVWIDYGISAEFGGLFNLRFDDTNPVKEEQEFVDAIRAKGIIQLTTFEDGVKYMEFTEAVSRSMSEGTAIPLPLKIV